MISKVKDAINKYGLLDGVTEVTVALSGGADSVALLSVLNELKDEYGFNLFAAHFNHGIRGEEADRDEKFCFEICKKFSIPLFCEKGDVPLYAKEKGISIETAARDKRYEFLSKTSKGVVATAHTASDNLETILFNLSRGASLKGLKGIPAKRDKFIRPLIFCTREDIENYLSLKGLTYVTDSTNLVDDCSRNIIRHKVVPVLKSLNEKAENNASKTAVLLNEDEDFLNKTATNEYKNRICGKYLDVKNFSVLHRAISSRVVDIFYYELFGKHLDYSHILSVLDVCLNKSKKTALPDNYYAVFSDGKITFTDKLSDEDTEFKVEFLRFSIDEYNKKVKVHELFANCAVDFDKIIGKVNLIEKNSSDKIKLINSNSTKTLKKLLTERSVKLSYRKNLPVISDQNGVIWVYNVGVADRVKIDSNTKNVLYFNTLII